MDDGSSAVNEIFWKREVVNYGLLVMTCDVNDDVV